MGKRSTPFQRGLFVNVYFWKWLRCVHVARQKKWELKKQKNKFCNIIFERNAHNSLKWKMQEKRAFFEEKKGIKAEKKGNFICKIIRFCVRKPNELFQFFFLFFHVKILYFLFLKSNKVSSWSYKIASDKEPLCKWRSDEGIC